MQTLPVAIELPLAKSIDVDLPKSLLTAVQVLALSGQALKLDLVVIVDLLPNTLHLDAWMQAEETAHTVFPLQENLHGVEDEINTNAIVINKYTTLMCLLQWNHS